MKEEIEYEEVELFASLDDYQINEICAILTENDIPFIKKNGGTGSYMNLYMGHSIQEKKVFVSKKDYDKSLELISIFTINNIDEEGETLKEKNQAKNDRTGNILTLISKIEICLVLILPIVLVIFMLVLLLCQ